MNTENYTKYPQFCEFAENIHRDGCKFLKTLLPKELPATEEKQGQATALVFVVAGFVDFTPNIVRAITMFALDIDDPDEADFYVEKFADELVLREKAA